MSEPKILTVGQIDCHRRIGRNADYMQCAWVEYDSLLDSHELLRVELAELREQTSWRKCSEGELPKQLEGDCTSAPVEVWAPGQSTRRGRDFHGADYYDYHYGEWSETNPTHWRPLGPPPENGR